MSDLSLKTATPGKVIPNSKKTSDDHTMANSIITYDTKTTKGKSKVIIDDDSSIESLQSLQSMNREQLIAYRKESEQLAKAKTAGKDTTEHVSEENVIDNADSEENAMSQEPADATRNTNESNGRFLFTAG